MVVDTLNNAGISRALVLWQAMSTVAIMAHTSAGNAEVSNESPVQWVLDSCRRLQVPQHVEWSRKALRSLSQVVVHREVITAKDGCDDDFAA